MSKMAAIYFMYADSRYFMYAESCYFTFMLTADEAANEAAETLKPREVVYFMFILFMQKAVLEAEAACVIPGSSREFQLPLSAVTGSWIF